MRSGEKKIKFSEGIKVTWCDSIVNFIRKFTYEPIRKCHLWIPQLATKAKIRKWYYFKPKRTGIETTNTMKRQPT